MKQKYSFEDMTKEEIIAMFTKKTEQLESTIRKLREELEKQIAKYEKLHNEYQLDKYNTYAKKTEKTKILVEEGISKEEDTINEVEVVLEKEKTRKERKKGTTQKEQFVKVLKELVTKTVIEDYDFESNNVDKEKVKPFGEDRTIKIEASMRFDIVEIIRPKYKDKDKIYQRVSNDPFPHSVLTPSLAASIINFKYRLGVPLYRYVDMLNTSGIEVSESDLCNYVLRVALKLEPIYKRIKEQLTLTKLIHVDETTLEVIDVKEKSKCYVFVYQTGNWEEIPLCLYEFNESRKTDKVNELLKDYRNYLVCDGYTGYDNLREKGIKIQRCWVHIRRYFVDCYKILNGKDKIKHPAYKIVESINKLFKEEKRFKENNFTASQIKEERNKEGYQKKLKEIDDLIIEESKKEKISENLLKAVNYYMNIKTKGELYTFLEDGVIEIDNNIAERAVKPFVIGRKNFMFCKTTNGADVSSMLYSIVQTAIKNGIEPEDYICYALEKIDRENIEEILPWSKEIQDKFKISKYSKMKNPAVPEKRLA